MAFRSAVMWLLLLALPLQGFAAASMLNCGPNHHQQWEASIGTAAAAHEHSGHGDHHHPTDSADPTQASTPSAPDDVNDESSVHPLSKLTQFKCSACAACCMGAALPASALTFQSPPPAAAPDFSVLASHVGFLTDGPDRPPRHLLV